MNLGNFRKMRLVNLIVCLAFCLNLGLSGNALALGKVEKASVSMLREKSASDRVESTILGLGIEMIKELYNQGPNKLKANLADLALDKVTDPIERGFIENGIGVLQREGKAYIVCLIGNGWKVDLSQHKIKVDYFASVEERDAFISGGQLTWIAGEYTPAQLIDAQDGTSVTLREAGEQGRIFRQDGPERRVAQYSATRTSVARQLPPLDGKAQAALVERLKKAFNFRRGAVASLTQEDINAMMAIGLPADARIKIGAENFSLEGGAAVGTTTVDHLQEIGIKDSIVGHSATRQAIVYDKDKITGEFKRVRVQRGDTDDIIRNKLKVALENGLKVTLCVGENLRTRELDKNAVGFVLQQLENDLGALNLTGEQILALLEGVAYEPIWAINTGVSAQSEQIQEMHAAIRKWFADKYGQEVASKIVLKYGGSVNTGNAEGIFALADVDGALIGGASLRASLAKIVEIANAAGKNKGKTMHVSANWKAEDRAKRDVLTEHFKALAGVNLDNAVVNYYLPYTLLAEAEDLLNKARSPKLADLKQDLQKVDPAIVLDEEGRPSFYYKGEVGSSKYLAVTLTSGRHKYEGYDFEKAGQRGPRSTYEMLAMTESYMEMAKTNPEALLAYRLKQLHDYFEISADSKLHRQERQTVIDLINKYDKMALDMWKQREANKAKAKLERENNKVVLEATLANIAKFLDPKLEEVIPDELIGVANQGLQRLVESGLLTDYQIKANAGDIGIISMRQNRNAVEDDALVPAAIVNVFLRVLDKAKEMGVYQAEDLSKKSYLEQARAVEIRRPYVPLKYTERAADPFGVFWASNTYVGAHNMLIWQILSDPMYNAGLTIDPEAMRGFIFEVWDSVEDTVCRFDGETENNKLRAQANQPGRYAIVAVYSKAEHKVASDEPIITVTVKRMADDGKSKVGDFSPLLIVRSQSGLPAWGELIAPTGTVMPIITYGGDKTQHIVAWRPTSLEEANKIPASRRKGLSLLAGFGFQSHDNGYFGITEDIGAHQTLIPARENAGKWARLFFGEPETELSQPVATSVLEKMKTEPQEKVRVGINGGAGRIGTTLLRAWLRDPSKQAEVVAINDAAFNFSDKAMTPEAQLKEFVDMLYDDTVHHQLAYDIKKEDIKVGKEVRGDKTHYYIDIKGRKIYVSDGRDPAQLPWKEHNVDVVIEATGRFTDKDSASKHLQGGAKLVIISAPSTGGVPVPTFVIGVNQSMFDKTAHKVVSNASCTTNCLAPLAAILQQAFGIKNGSMDTVHAFTSDQALVDILRPTAPMRGKAASENIVPTSTGAARAIGEVIPELKGKLDGIAERVPVADASMLILTVTLDTPTTKKEINQLFKEAAGGALKGVLAYEEKAIASSSVIGRAESSIVIGDLTQVSTDGKTVTVRAYYDNEFGYSSRLLDLAQYTNSAFSEVKEKEVLAKRRIIQLPPHMNHITQLQPFKTPHEYMRDDRVVETRQRLDSRFKRNPDLKAGESDPLLQKHGDYTISNIKADIGSVPGHYKPHRVTIQALTDTLAIARSYGFKGVNQFLNLTRAVTILRTGLTIDEIVSKDGVYRKSGSEALMKKVNEFRQKTKITNWDEALAYLKGKTKDESLIALVTSLRDAQIDFDEFTKKVVADSMADALNYFTISEEKASPERLEILSIMDGLTAASAKNMFDTNAAIRKALGLTTDLAEDERILDFKVWAAGDDCQLTMKHKRLPEDKLIHTLAWDAFWYAADQTSYFKPYGWKQDILVDRLVSGNIQGAGPGYAEVQVREDEEVDPFSADKSAPGAFTVPILGITRKARAEGRFLNGLFYEVWDINNRPRAFFYSENPQDMQDMLTLLSSPEEFAIKRVWEAKKKWDGKEPIENVLDDFPLISASTERLVLTAGAYVGKDDPTFLVRITKGGFTTEEVIDIFQYPQVTLGFMRGSHIGPLVPGTQPSFLFGRDKPTDFKPEATPHLFDGPPPLTGLVLAAGKPLNEAEDAFAEAPWLKDAIEQGNFITQVLRRQGAFPPHKVDGAETEYTTAPAVMAAIKAEGRARPGDNTQEAQFLKSLLALQSKGISNKLSEGVIGVARDAANKKVILISARLLRSDPSLILALQSINEQINQNLGDFVSKGNIEANAYRFVLVADDPALKTAQDVEKLFAAVAKATNNGARASKDMFAQILTQEDMYEGTISDAASLLKQLKRMGISEELVVALVGSKEWTDALKAQEGISKDTLSVNAEAKANEVAFAANALFAAVEVVATTDKQVTASLAKKLELVQEATSIVVAPKGVIASVTDTVASYRERVEEEIRI